MSGRNGARDRPRGMGVLRGFSRNCPSERGIAFAAGSLGVWESRCGMQEVGCVPHPTRRDGTSRRSMGQFFRAAALGGEIWYNIP